MSCEQPAADTGGIVFQNPGYCPCCRRDTTFTAHQEWLRDFYLCDRCGSIPRQRHLQSVLDRRFPDWGSLCIHESSPSNDFISRYSSDYSASQFFADVPRGESRQGVRSENIEDLTFADESIDLFITQDVLEHVFNPDRALAEIHRVLRPGGAHIFTAPKHKGLIETRQRAAMRADGTIEHLLPEEYHGNPIGDNRALVTYDYGYDFEQLMSTWSGVSVEAVQTLDRSQGLDALFNEVFVITKPPRVEVADDRPRSPFADLRQPATELASALTVLGGRAARKAAREVRRLRAARG